MHRFFASVFAAIALLGAVAPCQAQDKEKPWVVVSFAGYDKLMSDIAMIGELGGNAQLRQQLEMMTMILPRGDKAKGPLSLDPKRPWGAVVLGDTEAPVSYAFLPITDIKPLVDFAKLQFRKDIKPENGVYRFPSTPKNTYAIQKGEWTFLADAPETLKQTVDTPTKFLGDLPNRYDLAIRATLQNLPAEYREQLLAQLRAGVEVGMQMQPTETEEQFAVRQAMTKKSVEQLTMMINDMDNLLLGWNIDAKSKTTYLDLEVTARTGTDLAKQFAHIKPGKSDLAGLLLPDATVTFSSVGTMGDVQAEQTLTALDTLRESALQGIENQGLSDEEAKLLSRLLNDALDVLQKTIESRKTDLAVSVMLDPSALTVVGGSAIAEGAKLDKTLQDLVAEIKKDEKAAEVMKVSDETVAGIHLYTVSMPTPDPEMSPLLGDTLEIAVGVANDKLLLSAGRDAAEKLKNAVGGLKSAAGKELPPLRITVAVEQLAAFIAEAVDDPQTKSTASVVASMLAGAGDQGHLTITASPIPQGVRLRLELEEGLLKTVGAMTQMMGAMGPGAPGS